MAEELEEARGEAGGADIVDDSLGGVTGWVGEVRSYVNGRNVEGRGHCGRHSVPLLKIVGCFSLKSLRCQRHLSAIDGD